jgi:hypothetical protein
MANANGRWTPERAARIGFLAGRGVGFEAAMADYRVGAKSERALRCAASRWGLSFGLGGGQIAVQLTAEDRDLLTFAAGERGVSSDVLMATVARAVDQRGARRSGQRRLVIEIPSRAVRDYLVSFGVVAIFVTSVGKLGIGRDLARAAPLAAAWWVRDRRTAEQILIAIGEEHPQTVEEATRAVEAAAARLGVTLNDHAAVMQRTRAAVDRLNGKLEAARRNGNLQLFNRAYHAYRLGCQQRGEHAMAEKEIDALSRVIVEVEQQRDDALAERTSLHPDRTTAAKLKVRHERASQFLKEHERMLAKKPPPPRPAGLPRTWEEWEAQKWHVKEERKAKRNTIRRRKDRPRWLDSRKLAISAINDEPVHQLATVTGS